MVIALLVAILIAVLANAFEEVRDFLFLIFWLAVVMLTFGIMALFVLWIAHLENAL